MTLDEAAKQLEAIARDPRLWDDTYLRARIEALDTLRFIAEVCASRLRQRAGDPLATQLQRQAEALRAGLQRADRRFFNSIREGIRHHRSSSAALRELFGRYTAYAPANVGHQHLGPEPLDHLVAGVFLRPDPPESEPLGSVEMVAYQPTPASVVLEIVDRLDFGPDATFCDIGSGLGLVVLLFVLLAGSPATGIEVDPRLCAYAARVAEAMDLPGITFVNADARWADLEDATTFYLFTPFTGDMLQCVLARLEAQARHRRLRIAGYGPITPHLARLPWLRSLSRHEEDEFRLALFESRAAG